jgi:hypothetical protein
MSAELQPAWKVTVWLDGDDYPPTATQNVEVLLEAALSSMEDGGAIRRYTLEPIREDA